MRDTDVPLGPAGPLRVIVPVAGLPPVTDVGFRLTDASDAGLIVNAAVWLMPGFAVL